MKLSTLALGVAAGLALSSAANAQVMGVTGLFAEAGLGVRTNSVEVNDVFGPGVFSGDIGERSFLGSLRAGWRGQTMPNLELGASVFWNPADEDAGRVTVGTGSATLKQWSHWGIGAEAGWKVAAPTTVYARIEYHRTTFELSTSAPGLAAESDEQHNGWGYGFGLRHTLQQNMYVFAEWQQIEYDDEDYATVGGGVANLEPRNTLGLIGLGMSF